MSDYTTVIDTTTVALSFSLINKSVSDTTNNSLLSSLNKYFCLGPNGSDTTFTANTFSPTGYPVIQFTDRLRYNFFTLRYRPEFAVFNNSGTGSIAIGGNFYYNTETLSIDCYFTDAEKEDMIGLVFNNIILFFVES